MLSPPDADGEPFRGGGEIRALLRSVDWSKTPLGAIASWPKTLVGGLGLTIVRRACSAA